MKMKTDIVIVGDDGKTYKIPTKLWMKPENKIPAAFAGDAGVLVKRGALIAEVPKPDFPVGYYCVLVNFSEIEAAPSAPSEPAKAAQNIDIGTEGLVIHISRDNTEPDGAYYVVDEKTWQKLVVDPSTVADAAELAKRGALCAVTKDGLLVNLDAIGPAA
jgi:hypothetical protein